jgi:hypothetical protein
MICRIYDVRGGIELYDAVNQRLGDDSNVKPPGGHVHIAAVGEEGFKVIEVWDSKEDDERYLASGLGQAIQEVLGEAGIPDPTITDLEVHRFDWAS